MTTKTAEIECINKSHRQNPHERIINVGGSAGGGWMITQQRAIELIEAGEWNFYTRVGAKVVWVIVASSRYGNKYLKTQGDGEHENNLLSLSECP